MWRHGNISCSCVQAAVMDKRNQLNDIWELEPQVFTWCRTVKTATLMTKVACTLTVNHKKYMFNHLLFFFYKVSIKNRFLYKMFFLLHLLQVQQHMMVTMTMRRRWRWLKQRDEATEPHSSHSLAACGWKGSVASLDVSVSIHRCFTTFPQVSFSKALPRNKGMRSRPIQTVEEKPNANGRCECEAKSSARLPHVHWNIPSSSTALPSFKYWDVLHSVVDFQTYCSET